MRLYRLLAMLPVLLAMATGAQAGARPVSQDPGESERPANGLGDQAAPGGYGNPFLWTCLADLARGEIAQAEEACGRAVVLDPGNADAYELRGYAYLVEHRFEKAEADFLVAMDLKPNSAEILAGYGQSLTGQGRFEAAVAQFAQAVALSPTNAAYHNALCWARAGTGTAENLNHAMHDCNTAIALAPGTPAPLNSRGMVELRLGRFDAAIADYTASLTARPQQPSARFGRGLAHLSLGQVAAGNADILGARQADPEIDDLFVSLGVLPRECGNGVPKCPPGFPPVSHAPLDYRGMSVTMKPYSEKIDLLDMMAVCHEREKLC